MARKRLCGKTGCNELIGYDDRYCDKHKDKANDRHKDYDKFRRNEDATKFYKSKQWQSVRLLALARDIYLCVQCLKNKRLVDADVVDHIKPIEQYPELALTLSNLQCLCHACHNAKTVDDKKLYGGM